MSFGPPYMQITCYYLEVTPGVKDPAHDIPLGCTYVDFYGQTIGSTTTGGAYDPGVHGGGGLKGSKTCSSPPEAIGDTFIPKDSNQAITITGMNSVWDGGEKIGWIYQGSDGNRYARVDPGISYPIGIVGPLAVSYYMIRDFGFGLTSAPTDTQIAKIPAGQKLSNGAKALQCFTNGQNLNP